MITRKMLKSKPKGSAVLLLIAVILVLLFLTGMGILTLGLRSRIYALRVASEIAARCAADAGLTKAVFEVNEKLKAKPWSDSNLPSATNESLPNCNMFFSYMVTDDGNDIYTIESIGTYGQAERRTYATLELKGLFENTVLVINKLSLCPSTTVTGINSSDPTDTDIDVKIGTLSTAAGQVTLGPGTVVDGDGFCGVGGDPSVTIGAGGTFTGQKYALNDEPPLPAITPPSLTNMGGPLSIMANTTITPANNGQYTAFSVAGSVTLTVDGGDVVVYMTGDVTLGTSSTVIIKANSTLTIYLDGTLIMANGSGFLNENTFCGTLAIFSTSSTYRNYDIKAKSSIFGVVYAPNATIALMSGAEIVGAIVAESFEMKNGATFYYDEALRDVGVDDVGTYFVVDRWHED
jgi:cytoskeletal protein CcmA (bactofilin family)